MARKMFAALAAVFVVLTVSSSLAMPASAADCPFSVLLTGGPTGPSVSGDTGKIQVHSLELTETQTEKITWKPFPGYQICSASGLDSNGAPWSSSDPTGGSHTTAVGARLASGVITAKEAAVTTTTTAPSTTTTVASPTPTTVAPATTTTAPSTTTTVGPTTPTTVACPPDNAACYDSPSLNNPSTPDLRDNPPTGSSEPPAASSITTIPPTTPVSGKFLALTGISVWNVVLVAMYLWVLGGLLYLISGWSPQPKVDRP